MSRSGDLRTGGVDSSFTAAAIAADVKLFVNIIHDVDGDTRRHNVRLWIHMDRLMTTHLNKLVSSACS